MKKFVILSLLIVLMGWGSVPAGAGGFEVAGQSAILMDPDSGQILFSHDPHKKSEPASITKIMVMLLIQEAIDRGEMAMDDMVTVSRHAQSMHGSQIYLQSGDRVSVYDLLKAVAISSANDATVALAEYYSGSESAFVRLMNRRAEELGMENTHFENTTGLPPEEGEHYSSAYDIALMSQEFVKYPELLEMTSIWMEYLDLPNRQAMLVNFNRLVRSYPGVDGIKTGHTTRAGYCLAATAERDGRRFIAVIMNVDSEETREEEMIRLLDYAFRAFSRQSIFRAGDEVETLEVPSGRNPQVKLVAADNLLPYVRRGSSERVELQKELSDLRAPLEAGEVVGTIRAYHENDFLGEVEVQVKENVDRANFLVIIWRTIANFFKNLLSV